MTQKKKYSIGRIGSAVVWGELEIVKELLPEQIKYTVIQEHGGHNLLQHACYNGKPSLEMIKYLLDNGIDVNDLPNTDTSTPLTLLCKSGRTDLERIKFLVENGANLGEDTYKRHSEEESYYCSTSVNYTYQGNPLQILLHLHKSKENLVEMCQFLIEKGCDLNSDFCFELHRARSSTEMHDSYWETTTNTLGAYCCNSESEAIDHKPTKFFTTILHELIKNHQKKVDLTKIVRDFLIYGADTQIKDSSGKIALDYLLKEAINYKVLEFLLKGQIHEILLENDFQHLWKSKELTDFEIQGIKCHKQLIEVRTKQDPEIVKKTLEKEYSRNNSENFLKWVYGKKYHSSLLDENLIKHLGIQDVIENSMEKSWEEAYLDETKKDFTLLVTWKFDPEEEEEEEEEEEIVEIKIHKTLLFARLGLFREMFTKLEKEEEEKISQVKDHSEKRVDTITIFMGFLYKNKIETSGDYELTPKVLKEIVDLPQYFKMGNTSSNYFKANLDL
ncbi:phytochrome-interacting ankyrin-repeat protein [Anaeramoeba flamelloides]|uniref:Phytochrome-interacting ankyrin-repeat protein n=1 Tax=Anaeramoeba flamelloides TaxID=1746091 RepID=A0ABQ8XLY8_9EUKA|nr:phytochrome-interacting ankyrin-repeat protein [Anaeramoeba flamelloides]